MEWIPPEQVDKNSQLLANLGKDQLTQAASVVQTDGVCSPEEESDEFGKRRFERLEKTLEKLAERDRIIAERLDRLSERLETGWPKAIWSLKQVN